MNSWCNWLLHSIWVVYFHFVKPLFHYISEGFILSHAGGHECQSVWFGPDRNISIGLIVMNVFYITSMVIRGWILLTCVIPWLFLLMLFRWFKIHYSQSAMLITLLHLLSCWMGHKAAYKEFFFTRKIYCTLWTTFSKPGCRQN